MKYNGISVFLQSTCHVMSVSLVASCFFNFSFFVVWFWVVVSTVCGWALDVWAWYIHRVVALSCQLCEGPQQDRLMLWAGHRCVDYSWYSAWPAPCHGTIPLPTTGRCVRGSGLLALLSCEPQNMSSPVLLQPLMSSTFAGWLLAMVCLPSFAFPGSLPVQLMGDVLPHLQLLLLPNNPGHCV